MSDATERGGDRLDRLEDRLRQVLNLLVNAPVEYTRIPDSQGDFQGNDSFIGTDLRVEAAELLAEWDEEDASAGDGAPTGDGTA